MPKTRPAYPESFRREALELVRQGRSVADVAESLGVSSQTLRNWRRQGERPETRPRPRFEGGAVRERRSVVAHAASISSTTALVHYCLGPEGSGARPAREGLNSSISGTLPAPAGALARWRRLARGADGAVRSPGFERRHIFAQ